jgi:GntR family transcriptional repressor for pyruvate dehydrogenase complex
MARDQPADALEDVFVPVVSERISATIAEQIRAAILDRRLAPGDRLPNERSLAERFKVSRVTVRDALRALEAAGLVQIRVGATGGAFVTAPSAGVVGAGLSNLLMLSEIEPDEVAEARLIFELGTVTLAVERATDEDLAELRGLCDEGAEALAAGAYTSALSQAFHARLATAAQNHAVELMTASFAGPLSMHRVREREPADASHARTVQEHRRIVDAIAARDGAAARDAMTEHLLRGTTLPRAPEADPGAKPKPKPKPKRAAKATAKAKASAKKRPAAGRKPRNG